MKWLNAIRRWFHIEEVPPATSGDTSILFCLQNKSPMTLEQLHNATRIPYSELRVLLKRLSSEAGGNRIAQEHGMSMDRTEASTNYWIRYKPSTEL